MLSFAERWCDCPARVRLVIWLLMTLGLTVGVWIATRVSAGANTPVTLTAQWQKVMPLRGASGEFPLDPSEAFSAFDFDNTESRLLSWQPAEKGGALRLEAAWSAIPPLFARLAKRHQAVRGFSIQPGEAGLTLTLQLEGIDDE